MGLNADTPRFKPYDKTIQLDFSKYYISEKYDGIFAIWDGKNLKSKNKNIIKAPKNWLVNFPEFTLYGELWSGYDSFSKTLSIISKDLEKESKNQNIAKDSWDKVEFYVFDVLGVCENCPLNKRLEILKDYLQKNSNDKIKIIPQIKVKNKNELESFYKEVLQKGGEGVIIRQDSLNEVAYKYKSFLDNKCVVIGYTEGKGKFSGKMGALVCEAKINGIKRVFKIGSGFSDFERENPPQIGDIVVYKFQGYTSGGLPRFPVFLRINDI